MADEDGNGISQPAKTGIDEQINQVVSLISARSRGEVGNDALEDAVSGLLSNQPRPPQPDIEQDVDDYDDLDDAYVPAAAQPKNGNPTSGNAVAPPTLTIASMRKRDDNDEMDPLDMIPLGKEGARMMVTFGDGHNPDPEAVSAALLGARRCLQVAVKDARALRRHAKDEYSRARRFAILGRNKKAKLGPADHEQAHVDPNMYFRAMAGRDPLSFSPQCGFDVDQLKQLFPEEMNAYQRWNKMHKEYEAKSKDNGDESDMVEVDEDDVTADNGKSMPAEDLEAPKGHLEERAAQFDVRTDQMEEEWYLKFSEVRQGSFLPRRKGEQTLEERKWDSSRPKLGRGQHKEAGTWEHKAAATVKFLHWVGFDPQTALPPPNDETTHALAFLGYDFMGKIVEKAIYLRNVAAKGESDGEFLLELKEGEQLSAYDIEKAMKDSDVRPVSLYNAPDSDSAQKQFAAQLYFGPGFEDRLEMEMDELVSGSTKRKTISTEEMAIRRREDALFAEIEKPPNIFDTASQLTTETPGKSDGEGLGANEE